MVLETYGCKEGIPAGIPSMFVYSIAQSSILQLVDYQSRAQLGLKPGGLGGHDVAGVGNIHELLHRHGIEGEGHLHHTPLTHSRRKKYRKSSANSGGLFSLIL